MSFGRKELHWNVDENNCWNVDSHVLSNEGYPVFKRNKRQYRFPRWIYETCFGELADGLVVRHKCDNRACINPEHLESGTPLDNCRDMIERGRNKQGHGSDIWNSIFKESDIIRIRKSKKPLMEIAKEYGVGFQTISGIKLRTTWKHIPISKDDIYVKVGTKLTKEQVIEIRKSNKSNVELSKQYNVCRWTISDVKRGRNWKWLK